MIRRFIKQANQDAHESLTDVLTKLENNCTKEDTHVNRKNSHPVG